MGHLQVAQQSVLEVVDPAVHLERLAAFPGLLHRGALHDVLHLVARVQLAQAPVPRFLVQAVQLAGVLLRHVLHVAQPVVGQADAVIGHGRVHAAAAVVAAENDVAHLEDVDGELDHRQAVEVGVHHHVGDVAVDEHLARRQAGDLVGRHARVRAADPQVLGRLLVGKAGEILRIPLHLGLRPCAVAVEKMFQAHAVSPKSSRPISQRRISEVPAPIS
jgi:hypothetical protein